MAEIAPDSALLEVINSLDLAGVPEKLHCSTCHSFLLNAYKTSCCEQNICERCFNDVTDHCPMCKHKPFSKDLCRPAKAMRNTVKAYLRSVEKSMADERAKSQADAVPATSHEEHKSTVVTDAQAEANQEVENGTIEIPGSRVHEPNQDSATPAVDVRPSIEDGSPAIELPNSNSIPSQKEEEEHLKRQGSEDTDANDDEVEIQVEPSAEDAVIDISQNYEVEEPEQGYDSVTQGDNKVSDGNNEMSSGMDSNNFNMQNAGMMNFGNMGMDMNMMQQMMNMNMNQMMSMNMNMFGGFGGANGNMNGMSMMGMNFNPNQMFNGWNGQNSNMWQNNNAMNAMGGDFGSQYGSNMSQQGNFYPQQFQNGDFNGYSNRFGRGRFRGRGGYGRGRGNFNQYQQHSAYQNAHDQQQYEVQSVQQTQITQSSDGDGEIASNHTNHKEEEPHDQDDFAPGGQDEVQEALGDSDRDPKEVTDQPSPQADSVKADEIHATHQEHEVEIESTVKPERTVEEKIIPEAYHEDFETMAPPSAPTGPSRRYSDKDFAFRSRGHGKYLSRSSGSFSTPSGYPASPIRSVSQTSVNVPSPPNKGMGVVGAPTGPRAMREPPTSKPISRSTGNGGGFQIMGRASMQPQPNQTKEDPLPQSASPANDYDDYENDRPSSRRRSKYDKYDERRDEADTESTHDLDRNERDRDRRNKRSRRGDYEDDYEMQDVDQDHESQDQKTKHRSSRNDRDRSRREDRHSTSGKHRSSRRHYDDEVGSEYDRDDYGEAVVDNKQRSSRGDKNSHRYENDRERDKDSRRERKRDRDRDRDRERDRDRDREYEDDRAKEKEARHRKRSRHDRERDEGYEDVDEEESRHRSRRHKKEHHSASTRRERDREVEDPDLGLRISGRSNSNRQSTLPEPTSSTPSVAAPSTGTEKDHHTLEREARNRERMLKEQQRREKAALEKRVSSTAVKGGSRAATTSGGRRVSYKYEDEVERGMGGMDEREKARWR